MNDFESLVVLNMIPALGSISIKQLLCAFDRPRDIFHASSGALLSVEGITPKKVAAIKSAQQHFDCAAEVRLARDNKIEIITMLDARYPEHLKNIYDPPAVLYVKGALLAQDYNGVAVVGSRRPSFYGLSSAQRLSAALASRGLTVISGLARGIDTASHQGALGAGGRTIAVLGSGLLRLYPQENDRLADDISRHGALISEYSLKTPPLARNFPRRNRIISGLSLGVVVVEAAQNSGALITADVALEQSREVFAIPGKMDSATSLGCHRLIKEGAKLVCGVDDIIDEIKIKLRTSTAVLQAEVPAPQPAAAFDRHSERVYALLSGAPLHFDEIIERTKMNIQECSGALTRLQLQHLIKELPGKNFVRVKNETESCYR